MQDEIVAKKEPTDTHQSLEEMFSAGAHLAYTRSRRHPSTRQYIYGKKNKIDIIDLRKTADLIDRAILFVEKLAHQKKKVLFVGTKPEARDIVRRAAESIEMPYVTERWIGGLFTNFSEIKKRIARLKEIEEQSEKGELSVYTKKEQGRIQKELNDLNRKFGGVKDLDALPAAIFAVDSRAEKIACDEARASGIPIISLSGSDCDISSLEYPVVANNASIKSITFFVSLIRDVYKKGLTKHE